MVKLPEDERTGAPQANHDVDWIWDMPQTEELNQCGSTEVQQADFGIPAETARVHEPFPPVNIGDYPQSSEVTPTDKAGSSNALIASHVTVDGDAADGDELIQGGPDADWLWGGGGDDILLGGDGSDVLYSYDGDDYLDGGNGNDRLASFGGNDIIRGGDGDDWIDASRDCFVDGGAGYDVLAMEFGNSETPIVFDAASGTTATGLTFINIEGISAHVAGKQDNLLLGSDANEAFFSSSSGNDVLDGGSGNDTLVDQGILEGSGDDHLFGGEGNDRLQNDGGGGSDELTGGSGADTFS